MSGSRHTKVLQLISVRLDAKTKLLNLNLGYAIRWEGEGRGAGDQLALIYFLPRRQLPISR
ncbi:hypothetical protein RsS62_02230 [Rhizobium dioscoreae]|nr:hypothetical protein RsS62_02230 [Rhizobium dioscoreae]